MVTELEQKAPEIKPMCFSFSRSRPDLTKLDHALGVLSLQADEFKREVVQMENKIAAGELNDMLQTMKM